MDLTFFYDAPIALAFVTIISINFIAIEIGYRIGLAQQNEWKDADSGGGQVVLTAMFALLGLMLALTFAAGVSKADNRKIAAIQEGNALGTAFLRAGLVEEPGREDLRKAILAYAETRVVKRALSTPEERSAFLTATLRAQSEVWPIVERIERRQKGDLPAIPLLVSAINGLLDEHSNRLAAGLDKLPGAVVLLLILVAAASLSVAGFNAGLNGKISRWRMSLFAIVLGSVMYMIVDLDRPHSGLVKISQLALNTAITDMRATLGR